MAERPILTGFMVLDGYADDYSDWDGTITGPANPKGANLYWHDPIPMIEKRAFDEVVRDRDFANQQWRDWNAEADALAEKLEAHDASASREIDRLQENWEAAEKEVQALKLENARLREALKRIEQNQMCEYGCDCGSSPDQIARDALEEI